MNPALKSQIAKIKDRIRSEDPNVIDDILGLTEQYPDDPDVWHTLSYAYVSQEQYADAIAAITREMDLRPGEPATYFMRGGYSLEARDYHAAIADFTEGLTLGNHLEHEPYREVLHFLRAEAFYQLGRKVDALADLKHVKDDCVYWTIQVRSKAELVALCSQ